MTSVQHQFRGAQASLNRPSPEIPKPIAERVAPQKEDSSFQESYAQVESLVAPNSIGGLKPGGSTSDAARGSTRRIQNGGATRQRPAPLAVRFSVSELGTVRAKAKAAGCKVNTYIRASALGSDYRPPMNPELTRALLCLNRELTAQGNNLNQIARQLNAGIVLPGHGGMLDALGSSLQETLRSIREALASAGPGRGP